MAVALVAAGLAVVTGAPGFVLDLFSAGAGGVSSAQAGYGETCFGYPATITGTQGPDSLHGTNGDDVIVGLGGNDKINSGDGDDLDCGDEGNDTISAGDGDDSIDGGADTDTCKAGGGIDAAVNCEKVTGVP